MKFRKFIICALVYTCTSSIYAQENTEYIEFNDRKTVLYGIYAGINFYYGKIDGTDTYSFESQVSYIANQKFIIGLGWVSFYSNQNYNQFSFADDIDVTGGYGGLRIEPIFFSNARLKVSLPILLGLGYVGYVEKKYNQNSSNEVLINKNNDLVFVTELGVNLLYNVSRYIQLEAGIKYRISDKVALEPSYISNINGFSTGVGARFGVFNMGKNRYKKHINNQKE
tara:strand:+ start:5086 stop:5760 length:675 start_codon:yes stop_codon:yes gene_type:complete